MVSDEIKAKIEKFDSLYCLLKESEETPLRKQHGRIAQYAQRPNRPLACKIRYDNGLLNEIQKLGVDILPQLEKAIRIERDSEPDRYITLFRGLLRVKEKILEDARKNEPEKLKAPVVDKDMKAMAVKNMAPGSKGKTVVPPVVNQKKLPPTTV